MNQKRRWFPHRKNPCSHHPRVNGLHSQWITLSQVGSQGYPPSQMNTQYTADLTYQRQGFQLASGQPGIGLDGACLFPTSTPDAGAFVLPEPHLNDAGHSSVSAVDWTEAYLAELMDDGVAREIVPTLIAHPEILQEHVQAVRASKGKAVAHSPKRKATGHPRYCPICDCTFNGAICRTCER